MAARKIQGAARPRTGLLLMRAGLVAGTAFLLVACGPPVGVSRVSPRTVTSELTHSALNSNTPSLFSQNVLHRWHLSEPFRRDPEGALRKLRQLVTEEVEGREHTLFALAEASFEYLDLTEQTRALLKRALFVRPLPFVRRVVFIATPHRGSALTTRQVVRWLTRFVTLPVDVLGAATDLLEGNADAILLDPRRPRFGSIYDLRPGAPFLEALAATPIAPGIAAHSIIPVRGPEAGENATDGVVTYQSASIDGVESELVIPFAGHSVQGHPVTVEEVRRILLEHAMVVCRASGVACGPLPSVGRAAPGPR